MNNEYNGHSFIAKDVKGKLSKSEFKGLDIWFSYAEPIAISNGERVIVNSELFSPTTARHISYVKKIHTEIDNLPFNEFNDKLKKILDGKSEGRWYD